MRRLHQLVFDWHHGRAGHFPVCCVGRYLLDGLLDRPAAKQRGTDLTCPCRGFVACGTVHKLDPDCLACATRLGLDWSEFR
jgi:hypothetical protein